MKYDLKSMTRTELEKLSANISKALERVRAKEMKQARAAAEKAAKRYGYTLAEITGDSAEPKPVRRRAAKPKTVGKPKYANPVDKSLTWTGKGQRPKWFKEAIENGVNVEEMEI